MPTGHYAWQHSLGFETCHTDMEGRMLPETWTSLRARLLHHCMVEELDPYQAIQTHMIITGARPYWHGGICHQWFHDHPDELERLRYEVARG